MIRSHLATSLRHVNDVLRSTIFTPGDLVRIHDRPETIGIIIDTREESTTLTTYDPPEVIKIAIARVMWAVDPPETYTYRPQKWETYEVNPPERFIETSFVYAPYVPMQVTPTLFTNDDFKASNFSYYKRMLKK